MRKVLRHEELAYKSTLLQGAFYYHASPSDTHPGIHLNISTIFQLYRTKLKLYQRFLIYQRFDTTYRFTDNLRQGQTTYIPLSRKLPLSKPQNKSYRIYAIASCIHMQLMLLKPLLHLNLLL